MGKSRDWKTVRAEALAAGQLTEEGLSLARKTTDEHIQAYRLQQIRKDRQASQTELAAEMGVTQSRVSRIEKGDLAHVELATLRAYIQALGGRLHVVAEFGGDRMTLS